MANLTMADLLAKQEKKSEGKQTLRLQRNQEATGEIVSINDAELILDLGTKSEGVLPKKDLSPEQEANLRVGDKLSVFVLSPENEYGQVVLSLHQALSSKGGINRERWQKFQEAQGKNQILNGKALEVNKGGLIVEVGGVRGFLPSSQVALSQASDLDKMVGQDLQVSVIEVDPNQNRLIFSQKTTVTEETKEQLGKLKIGEKVKGNVAAVLPFGIFVTLHGEGFEGVEGLVHVSELSWEKTEEVAKDYQVGQEVEAQIISTDAETGRVNLSIRALKEDPFKALSEKYQSDDVIKGEVLRVNANGVYISLEEGLEGVMPTSAVESGTEYEVGESVTVLIDTVDTQKRKITLAPFITSTKGLIYK